MKKLTVVFILVIGWLQYSLWFGKHGINDYILLSKNVISKQLINNKLKTRNSLLFSEITYLTSKDSALIEEHERTELCMIKQGENFYRIIPKESKL